MDMHLLSFSPLQLLNLASNKRRVFNNVVRVQSRRCVLLLISNSNRHMSPSLPSTMPSSAKLRDRRGFNGHRYITGLSVACELGELAPDTKAPKLNFQGQPPTNKCLTLVIHYSLYCPSKRGESVIGQVAINMRQIASNLCIRNYDG